MVNETFVNAAGLTDPLDQKILYHDKPYYIIGVVKDFHSRELMRKIEPSIYFVKNDSVSTYLNIAFCAGSGLVTMELRERYMEKSISGFSFRRIFPE